MWTTAVCGECQDEEGQKRTQHSQKVLEFLILQDMERSGQQSKRATLLIGLRRTAGRKAWGGSFSFLGCMRRIRFKCSTHRAL